MHQTSGKSSLRNQNGYKFTKNINVLQWFFVTVADNFTRIFGLTHQSWAIRNYRNLRRIWIQNVFLTCAGSLPLLSNSKRFSMIFDIFVLQLKFEQIGISLRNTSSFLDRTYQVMWLLSTEELQQRLQTNCDMQLQKNSFARISI